MTSRAPHDGGNGYTTGGYHQERLDDLSGRLAFIEGRVEGFATKEDVANAKLQMVITWIGAAAILFAAVINLVMTILWRSSPS